MSIKPMCRTPVVVLLAIAACAAGAPVQLEADNIGLGQAVYSQPELAEALARTYEALEWQEEKYREIQDQVRNLDHIGGGNLLRNLDHIGGGNLLRDVNSEESAISMSEMRREQPSQPQRATTRRPGLAHGFKDDHSKWNPQRGTLDSLGGSNFVGRTLHRNLDHIGGGNLLRNVDKTNNDDKKPGPGLDDPSKWDPNRGTLDSLGGGNFVGRTLHRNLDHIGGGNLLRNVDATQRADETSSKPGSVKGHNVDTSKWDPQRGTLDSLGGGNFVGSTLYRNLDHIGGGNLLRDLDANQYDDETFARYLETTGDQNLVRNLRSAQQQEYLTTLRPGLADGFKDDPSKWSPNRGTLDQLGGGNLLSR